MITLASDFGTPYPAAMKGVILQRSDARLVDIAHDFPRQDVRTAAFWLREVLPWFPPAVHLVVVDPGVGTDRDALVIRAGDHALVGPDNGVLLPAARRLAAQHETTPEFFVIDVENPESSTFHGRDVFAPAAADAHEVGVEKLSAIDRFDPIHDVVDLTFPEPIVDANRAVGEVLVVDDFGNAITNIPGDAVADWDEVTVNGRPTPVGETFASVESGERLVTVGSHGNVECDVNQGRGDEAFDLTVGDEVELERIA